MSEEITYNREEGRYEMDVDGKTVYCETRQKDSVVFLNFVFCPEELRGTGAAGRFMKNLMETVIRPKNLKVRPVCGYAKKWLERHPDYKDLMAS